MVGKTFAIVSKLDEQRIAYGWAMVSETAGGRRIVDLQGDTIDPAELEKASVDFMIAYRDSGVMHKGAPTASVVASLVTTPELSKALGIPAGSVPVGWVVGVKIHDPEVWQKVRSGELGMFSIEGEADRLEAVDLTEV